MTNEEINEAVARKLGWRLTTSFGWMSPPAVYRKPDDVIAQFNVPDFCGSISAAWEVVEWLGMQDINGLGYSVSIFNMDTDANGWHCSISHLDSPLMTDLPQEKADTAPMAICLAFLKLTDQP